MIASAKAKHIRMTAQKVRLVLALIRGKSTQQALTILGSTQKRAAKVVEKLVRSAVANAKNKGIESEGLFISKICADEGATWKRFQANAFGRGSRILKRTCHISVEIDQKTVAPKIEPKAKKAAKKTQAKAPAKKSAEKNKEKTVAKAAKKTQKKAKSTK
jgi:large subunit ribosomal protein L22